MASFGVLNVNKPPGCSSRDVVDRVERIVRPAKAGHAGTLDPLASGVLVICVGKATRLIEYVQRMPKCYHATFLLGRRSDSDDVEGAVAELAGAPVPTRHQIEAALPRFLGKVLQRPPAHSAVKVAGRRAYQLARQGKAVELCPRMIEIHQLELMGYEYPEVKLEIHCGSGTYVRSIGRDLAELLGTAAVMSALERKSIGGFHIEEALPMEHISQDAVRQRLQPAVAAVGDMRRITLNEERLNDIRHGRPLSILIAGAQEPCPFSGSISGSTAEWAAVDSRGELVAILVQQSDGQLWPTKSFLS
jgi:tRNA pseudouridine55 synthase